MFYGCFIFVQDTEFFTTWGLGGGQFKMCGLCESCVSAIKIFPERDLHPTKKSQVSLM